MKDLCRRKAKIVVDKQGMKYDDMVIKQSRAIGTTESQLGGSDFSPRDLMYALALSDVS